MDPYNEAHIFVAAVRILQHLKHTAPPVEDVCKWLDISVESGLAVCRKLKQLGIIEILEDPFSCRLSVANHLEIEKLPREVSDDGALARDLEQFMAKKKNMDKQVEEIQAALKRNNRTCSIILKAR